MDFKVTIRTTLLLVDDDLIQLDLRARVLRMSGFDVITAGNPQDAISIMAQHPSGNVDIAVLDYDMPIMNGCVLAKYLKARDPELKIILYSGAIRIPESEMSSVDAFVSKGEGLCRLLEEVSQLAQLAASPTDTLAFSVRCI
jgi:DNA-binding NtrC family response regulator